MSPSWNFLQPTDGSRPTKTKVQYVDLAELGFQFTVWNTEAISDTLLSHSKISSCRLQSTGRSNVNQHDFIKAGRSFVSRVAG
jgi:hypothetical protein